MGKKEIKVKEIENWEEVNSEKKTLDSNGKKVNIKVERSVKDNKKSGKYNYDGALCTTPADEREMNVAIDYSSLYPVKDGKFYLADEVRVNDEILENSESCQCGEDTDEANDVTPLTQEELDELIEMTTPKDEDIDTLCVDIANKLSPMGVTPEVVSMVKKMFESTKQNYSGLTNVEVAQNIIKRYFSDTELQNFEQQNFEKFRDNARKVTMAIHKDKEKRGICPCKDWEYSRKRTDERFIDFLDRVHEDHQTDTETHTNNSGNMMEDVDNLISNTNVMGFNEGSSDYSKHKFQPWDIWEEYDLNPWDADIVKRVLRTKPEPGMSAVESRILDYKKIIHDSLKRIDQLNKNGR